MKLLQPHFPYCSYHSINESIKPVFVDTDKLTGNILPENVEEAVTNKTSGILATHNFGIPGNLDRMKILSENIKYLLFMMLHQP